MTNIKLYKKIGGGNKAFQIMMINLAIGCFLVSIGATPVTMLPPVLIAMGYSAFAIYFTIIAAIGLALYFFKNDKKKTELGTNN